MVDVRFSTTDLTEVGAAFARMQRATEDWSRAWPSVVAVLRKQAARQFWSEGHAGRSGAWANLKPDYWARKQRTHPEARILELSGRLRDSLTDEGHPDSAVTMRDKSLFFGSYVSYGKWHMEGTGVMARRPPISPTERDAAEWVAALHRHFDADVFKGYGRGAAPSVGRALVGI